VCPRKDAGGETSFKEITVFPLIRGREKGAVIRIDDITKRFHLENIMIQSEKMNSIAGLSAGMAHEINNPLAIITQGIQNIKRRLDPEKSKNAETAELFGVDLRRLHKYLEERKIMLFLDSSNEAVNRAAQIVKSMLKFSRQTDSVSAKVDIDQLIESTIELGSSDYDMKKKYDFKFVEIIREYDPAVPAVLCCASEIEQVLLNLFKNALQAMEEITVEGYKPQFYVRLKNDGKFVKIEIEDNGPGITEEVKKRIFEPFFTTKQAGIGTGLGLSVSYMIITQNHEGTFEVESEPGRFTRFIIGLPLNNSL